MKTYILTTFHVCCSGALRARTLLRGQHHPSPAPFTFRAKSPSLLEARPHPSLVTASALCLTI